MQSPAHKTCTFLLQSLSAACHLDLLSSRSCAHLRGWAWAWAWRPGAWAGPVCLSMTRASHNACQRSDWLSLPLYARTLRWVVDLNSWCFALPVGVMCACSDRALCFDADGLGKERKATPLWGVGFGLGSSAVCGTRPLQHHYPGEEARYLARSWRFVWYLWAGMVRGVPTVFQDPGDLDNAVHALD